MCYSQTSEILTSSPILKSFDWLKNRVPMSKKSMPAAETFTFNWTILFTAVYANVSLSL